MMRYQRQQELLDCSKLCAVQFSYFEEHGYDKANASILVATRADRWAGLLGAIMGTKASMKEGKAVKRAVKTALEKPEFSSQNSKQLKAALRELLTRYALSSPCRKAVY